MASNYKNPPKFEENMTYEKWKNELEVWQLVTDLDKKKQALAVTLTLTGRAREAALEVAATELNKDEGMKTLTDTLDKVFEKEKIDSTYEAYTQFDKFSRKDGTSISDYVMEYERLYNRCKKYKLELPDAVLAFKLLDGSGLDLRSRQMALTACSATSATGLTFDKMKSALNRIFSEMPSETSTSAISVKPEVAMFTKYDGRRSRTQWAKKGDYQSGTGGLPIGTNPLNKFGKRTRCAICQSVFHWAKGCPDKTKAETAHIVDTTCTCQHSQNVKSTEAASGHSCDEIWEDCHITLLTGNPRPVMDDDNKIFVTEAFGAAVVDTACTKTVCGETWLENYQELLSSEEKHAMKVQDSNVGFRFGDGVRHYSNKKVKLPAVVGDVGCHIEAEVVKADIPLLLSKSSLKKAGTVLDVKNDKITMFDRDIELQCTSDGHYCVNLRPGGVVKSSQEPDESTVLAVVQTMDEGDRKKALMKLHSQFGHCSAERLGNLLKNAGDRRPETQKEVTGIVDNCKICLKFKKPPPKPAAGLPLATTFNETVAVDLHQLEKNLWYLHIIDEFTRYSAGGIMKNKTPKEFVTKFIQLWISVHGSPKCLYSDNGGEFCNEEVKEMAENFNIELKNTPAESPWSNGLLERHNQTLTNIMLKVKEEQNCDYETALCWALMAKNCLNNAHGYSSHQLVYTENPNLPSVLVDKPPALEGTTTSENIAKHINALHAARKAFTEAECSERIRRALRKNLRPVLDDYRTGDKVYYKRLQSKEWKGPGTVIGQDGMVVFVKHGGTYVRVHRNRLRKEKAVEREAQRNSSDSTGGAKQSVTSSANSMNEHCENLDIEDCFEDEEHSNHDDPVVHQSPNQMPFDRKSIKTGNTVKFRNPDSQEWTIARVLGCAGKATGKNKNWFNLECLTPETKTISVDLSQVADLEVTTPETNGENQENVLIVEDGVHEVAKQIELENWKRNEVFMEVFDKGQKPVISTRWICSMKQSEGGPVAKARLVARGFEELDKEQHEKDAPTCSQEALKMVLAIMAQNGWKPCSMDIKAAFLQGFPLERDIYIKPPKEANSPGKLWLLKKCVYGLSDASLNFYNKVKKVLIGLGAKNSKMDPAVFFWSNCGELQGVLACHVDDFLWAGNSSFFQTGIIPKIREAFEIGKEENAAFRYTGLEIEYCPEESSIFMQQEKYASNLCIIDISKSRMLQQDELLNNNEKGQLRSKIGQILWIGRQSRPDVMYDACMLASNFNRATVKDILTVNKVIGKIKQSKLTLKFQPVSEPLQLTVFSDASFGNLPDGGTQGGYLILLANESGQFSPICWGSRKLRRIVRSTLAGETLALSDAIDVGVYLSHLYAEITGGIADSTHLPLVCVSDNKSLWDSVKSNKGVSEKRLRLEIAAIKEMIQEGIIKKFHWIESNGQLADILTKKGASPHMLLKTFEEGVLKI